MVELMITLVVAAILLAVGIPSFRSLIQNNKSVAQANQLVASLNFARTEALKRRAKVALCPMNSGKTGCGGGSNWSTNGWLAFVDANSNDSFDTASEELLKKWQDSAGKSDTTITGTAAALGYTSAGALTTAGSIGLRVSVSNTTDYDRCVAISPTGRVEAKKMSSGVTCP